MMFPYDAVLIDAERVPCASPPKVVPMLRSMHVGGDRAIQGAQEACGKFVTYCNEENSVLKTMAQARIHNEALAADIVAQNKKSKRREKDIAALQCEAASDTAAFQGDREVRLQKRADFDERERDLEESVRTFASICAFSEKTDHTPTPARRCFRCRRQRGTFLVFEGSGLGTFFVWAGTSQISGHHVFHWRRDVASSTVDWMQAVTSLQRHEQFRCVGHRVFGR